MNTDLAVVANDTSLIEQAADPGQYVVLACERAKAWLTEALEHGDIDRIVELKSQAEAIRVYTAQKQIGKDAELAATEIVRRAERGIGVAIRKGQEAGEIRSMADTHRPGHDNRVVIDDSVPGPTDFGVTKHELSNTHGGIYALADGVSDKDFENALYEGKIEGNLSRANVVRKVKGEPPPKGPRHELLHKTRHIRPERVVNETVLSLEGLRIGLALLTPDNYRTLDPGQKAAWAESLKESIRSLNRVLKELTQA